MTQFKKSGKRSEPATRENRADRVVTRRETEVRQAAREVIQRREKVLRELGKH